MPDNPRPLLALVCGLWLVLWGLLMLWHKRLPGRIYWRAMWNLLISAIAIALLSTLLPACSAHVDPPGRTAEPDPRDAVVVISCSRSSFDINTNDFTISREPCCNAFAVRDGPGLSGLKLFTAAHCLFGARPGADIAYNTRADLTTYVHPPARLARVLRVDLGYDRAQLSPVEALDAQTLGRVALAPGKSLLGEGAEVRSLSGFYEWTWLDGRTKARVYGPDEGAYYVTDLDVKPGWSGSPALDTMGRAVGIVTSCEGAQTGRGKACAPHTGNYSDLSGFW